MLKFLKSFTLAETLIVMGIIGVVAALTLPNLNSSTGDKEKVAKLQKIYSNLQDAFGRAEAVYGPYDEWFINDGNDSDKKTKRTFERISEFMKYSKVCTIEDNCSFKEFDSAHKDTGGMSVKYGLILADGSTIGFYADRILIDIDGFSKGPNSSCKDYFQIHYEDYSRSLTHDTDLIKYNSMSDIYNHYSAPCTAWVIVNGNMDYLKVGNDGKCPDGKTILNWITNTTCK